MIGKTISHYKIMEQIGAGGMGIVYKATDTKLDRFVALKFLPPNLSQDPEAKERFIHEAKAASALQHNNICTIYEIDETDDHQMYLAMEYLEGSTLKDKIEQGTQSIDESVEIIKQAAQGLEKAHAKDIVHRDIKPANILITDDGVVKIVDFGLAKLAGRTLITKEGTTLGTVAYMSPEQTQGKAIDGRADIWALGVVLYEMLAGERPFKGEYEQAVIYSILKEEPVPLRRINPALPAELEKIVFRCLQKEPDVRYSSISQLLKDLKEYQDRSLPLGKRTFDPVEWIRGMHKPRIFIPVIAAMLIFILVVSFFLHRRSRIKWVRQSVLPELERLVEENWNDFTEPYKLAVQAEKILPKDQKLQELISKCALNISVSTEPPGADVYYKEYGEPESEWTFLGATPLENIRMPVGIFRWKMEKEGYETVLAASSTWSIRKEVLAPIHITRTLDKKGTLPEGMVRVPGSETPMGRLDDFFIDRLEVTNGQYKAFINEGGYRNREFWKQPFVLNGRMLTWEQAMEKFVDSSGLPGPAGWIGGDFPQGQEEYPVSGISWYEAAAYAEYAGKSLPTESHWGVARGENTPMVRAFQLGGDATIIPFSNFGFNNPVETGSLQGMTAYGAMDMAGNVREWCWNETPQGRIVRGGSWSDATYMFGEVSNLPAFDRSLQNGFRCAIVPDPEKIPGSVFGSIVVDENYDFYKAKPVSEAVFQIYKEQFAYDRSVLNSRVENRDESSGDWIVERISFDAAYNDERIRAVLFLPKQTAPPYQTVIYFPGSTAVSRQSSQNLEHELEFEVFLSFVVKNGRAVLYPVYKGTMERNFTRPAVWIKTHRHTEYVVQIVKDFERCIDYLETRDDIDAGRLAYYGLSWGAGWPGVIIPAVERRIKVSVLLAGGLAEGGRPEVQPIHYITRVKTPALMMNGRYDSAFPFDIAIKPFYDLLGTPEEHKELKVYNTDHIPPRNEFIKEILTWLDKYLGPVNK